MSARPVPLRILLLALGGEGGGVLMNWIVAAARAQGFAVQATSVPGVAQRTGSTSYYVEIAPPEARAVLGLMPMPGRVDVVVASELVEAARAMELGFVSDRLTTLIASTNRVYSTAEKIDMADGRFDAERIVAAAQAMAQTAHLLDLDALARDSGTFISATMFGALAGSGTLPWDADASEAVIGEGPRAEASRRGFRAARDAVGAPGGATTEPDAPALPQADDLSHLPDALRRIVALGRERVTDHQDADYGAEYLARVERILAAADRTDHRAMAAVEEAARRLALWMAYEDIARVADLKTRPERFERIRAEAQVRPDQVLKVTEYLKPRAEELADVMPEKLGARIMARVERGGGFPFLGRGIRLRSNGVLGYWLLRATALLRHTRRGSLRFGREQAAIEDWLEAMCAALPRAPGFAEALANLPHVRKGYSDTLARGLRAYDRIRAEVVAPAMQGDGPDDAQASRLRGAISAAMADETHGKLDAFLAGDDSAARHARDPIPVLRDKPATATV